MAPYTSENESNTRKSQGQTEIYLEVNVRNLPCFSELNDKVQKIVRDSSWWERHGIDWMHIIGFSSTVPLSLYLLRTGGILNSIFATLLLGSVHSIIANKSGHLAVHGGLTSHPGLKTFWLHFASEFVGCYSSYMGSYSHVDMHHPYTNIIGLGDSSTWKAPFLGRVAYLFIMPLFLPIITPIVASRQLIELKKYTELFKFSLVMLSGFACHILILSKLAGFTSTAAFFYVFFYRAIFSVPFIHINIFQHIGLPMFSQKARPTRLYQMASGVLNLSRNLILDYVMGHSLISCHVEHHLFPKLSDNMALKIKPEVSSFLKRHGLPYHEDSYMNRLQDFYNRYDTLMVNAPPITHFVGIQ